MRTFSALLAASLLAACGTRAGDDDASAGGGDPLLEAEAAAQQQREANGQIACAVGGEADFDAVCTVEQFQGEEGLILTLRHPDGGFRRLLVTGDGRGVVAADGAEPAIVTPLAENRIEVSIADDRYRLPATVR